MYKLALPRGTHISFRPSYPRRLDPAAPGRMRQGGQGGEKRGKKQGFVGGKRKVTPTGYVETSMPGATIGILFPRAFPRIWLSSPGKSRGEVEG